MSQGLRGVAVGGSIVRSGLLFMWYGPKWVYDFFDKGARYHFLHYVAVVAAIADIYLVAAAILKHGVGGAIMGAAFMCMSVGGLLFVARLVEKLGGVLPWFAWYPGLGYRTKDGTFKPLFGDSGHRSPLHSGSGAAKADETFVRGAAVVNGEALAKDMKRGASEEQLSLLVEIGGVPVPYTAEPEHFLISGKTGAGKSQAINGMLRVVRKRGQSAIIADPIGETGGYISRFGRDGDAILNPFDARSESWSPFVEIREDYDCQQIAKAAIPDAHGDSQEWHFYAQTVLAEVMRSMHNQGKNSVKELLRLVMAADVRELADVLKETPAAILTAKGNEKMLSNTRAIASLYLNTWTYLKDGGTFSVRQWVRDSDASAGQWLFLTYRDNQLAMLRQLVATWLDLAVMEGLSLSESQSRRLWFVMDELDSLGKVPSLRAALTKIRKYGGVCVSGLQTIAQLRTTYGRDEAQTLLSCMTTKLVLAAGDGETAEYMEKELGKQEVRRPEVSTGTSQRVGELASTSENRSDRVVEQSAVMASEIQGLPNLHGFLKLAGMPLARIILQYVSMPDLRPAFEPKKK